MPPDAGSARADSRTPGCLVKSQWRIQPIHFARYREDSAADVRAFRACLKKFQDTLPGLWGGQLMPHAEVLQDNTVGCIGTLKSVLIRAVRIAQARGGWSEEVLRDALLTEAQREQILRETLDGERLIQPGITRMLSKPTLAGKGRAAA